jgi:transposase
MATERLSMRQAKEILRQKWLLERTHREIARSVGVGASTVSDLAKRARNAGIDCWDAVEPLGEDEVEQRLYGLALMRKSTRPGPDPAELDIELRRKGVTLQLLHLEYLDRHPDGYRYTQFCQIYRDWQKRQGPTMRQVHRAGEKLFVDYSGAKPSIVDPHTGEVRDVELFVAVLGASSYTYAEATLTQSSRDWIRSHENAFAFFGGATELVVPDQLKSGVTKPCRYEPGVQRTYEELLCHYGAIPLPARQRKPRDKAKAEVGVQVAQRWILARLRNQLFYSLAELNARIKELLRELNGRAMRAYGASRRQLFERLDQPVLAPLPASRFVYGEWHFKKPGIDYHVDVEGHYYSAPHTLSDETFDVRVSASTVELWLRGKRIASHVRSHRKGRHSTNPAHMPASHRAHAEWSPSRLIRWATKVGPETATLVALILRDRPHPEQGYRSCLGIMRLGKQYGKERLEAASMRAVAVGARSYKHVAAILKNGIDRLPMPGPNPDNTNHVSHGNIRGPAYYQGDDDDERRDRGETENDEADRDARRLERTARQSPG